MASKRLLLSVSGVGGVFSQADQLQVLYDKDEELA
jgi:hypothetical protein